MKKLRVLLFATFIATGGSLSLSAQNTNDTQVTGPGKPGYVPLWLGPFKIGDSNVYQNSSGNIGVGTTSPGAALDVNGAVNATNSFNLGGTPFGFGSVANRNAFLGFSGNSTMTGVINTAVGAFALQNNTTGYENDAHGYQALFSNTTGYLNAAVGVGALFSNTSGQQNTAFGGEALQNNTTGSINTATGVAALTANTTGFNNTGTGWSALKLNTSGNDNTGTGYGANSNNTTGGSNTADGMLSLYYNTTGNSNAALGFYALLYNVTGSNNTAVGVGAGPDINSPNLSNATAIGAGAVVSQSNALVLGSAGVNVGIGTATPSNVFTIAKGAGQAISDGWMTYSSRRWKTNIHTLDGALEKVEQLRGVSYDAAASGKHEIGVIAEEVGAVVPEVVAWDKDAQEAQGVDYSRLTALLIQAAKEQQALIREQREQIDAVASELKTIRASLEGSGQTHR